MIWLKKIGSWFKKIGTKIGLFFKKVFKPLVDKYNLLPNKKKKAIQGYLYILPWIIGIIIFGIYQIAMSFRISMANTARYIVDPATSTVHFKASGFGIKQYLDLFKNNPDHLDLILTAAGDIFLVVPLVIIFALLLALLLKQKIRGVGIFRTIFFIPVILLSGNLLGYFSQYGLLNMPGISNSYIYENIAFYFTGFFARIIVSAFSKIVLILWLSGVQTLIFLSALQKIDKSVYEAAAIDGASSWDGFWKITLPVTFPFMIINIVYTTVIYSALSNNGILVLINETLVNPVYGRAYSSALSWLLFIIELLVIGFYTLIIKLSARKYQI